MTRLTEANRGLSEPLGADKTFVQLDSTSKDILKNEAKNDKSVLFGPGRTNISVMDDIANNKVCRPVTDAGKARIPRRYEDGNRDFMEKVD
jgi:hypothetical protein